MNILLKYQDTIYQLIMTKKIIAIACSLVLSLSPHAQSIDESFIKSLPANIQQDFLKQSKSEINQNENVQSPDTRIKNIEAALDEAETTLESIKNELENQSDKSETNLERFGSNFFDSYQSSFLPINQPNLSPDYILDAGDVLNIQIIGQRNLVTNQKIKRDGTIKIPDIGSISIAGLSLRIASDLITETIAQSFTGAKSFVSISELRDINVLIVGNSNNPGMYTISGGSSPLMLIDVSGGISNKGSYRKISHKRNNQLLQNLDLYDVFIHGNLSFKHQLRSGDVLVIHPKLKEVRVSGSFANEAIFEIFDTENLSDYRW